MFTLRTRIIIALFIIACSILFIYPNFTEKELQIFFHEKYRIHEKTDLGKISKLVTTTDAEVEKWVKMVKKNYLRNGALTIQKEDLNPDWPKNRHYVIRGRFLTSAYTNKIIQANHSLVKIIDKQRTRIRTHPLEKALGTASLRLGLDLQGGLSILIQGDFESYLEELNRRYPQSKLKEWQKKIDDPKTPKDKVTEFQRKLDQANDELKLEDWEIREHLEHTRDLLENRLVSAVKIQDAKIKVVQDARSLEVSIPGVSNSEEIKEFLTETDTVSYHMEHDDFKNLLNLVNSHFKEFTELPPDERKDFVNNLEVKYNFIEKSAMLRTYYDRPKTRRKKKKDTVKKISRVPEIKSPATALKPLYFMVLNRKAGLEGRDIKSANSFYDQESLQRLVIFDLTDSGSKKFYTLTKENRGKRMAIVIGDKIRSAPSINDPIAGGRAQISGNFTAKEAADISRIMKEGALPIPLKVIRERNIGPSLGEETIERGILAIELGFSMIIIFMLIWYMKGGIIASIALILNLLVLGGLLSLGKVTITLPGFAGIILTLGMAVDTNVIIFERIKEEMRSGRTVFQSVDLGYSRALWTILDANITTLLAGIILIQLGEGPIKGFALTLCLGIISSLITGLFMSRIMFDIIIKSKPDSLRLSITSLGKN